MYNVVRIGKNEVVRKAWQNDDSGWTGYELTEAIGKDGRLYQTVNGEQYKDFDMKRQASDWVNELSNYATE